MALKREMRRSYKAERLLPTAVKTRLHRNVTNLIFQMSLSRAFGIFKRVRDSICNAVPSHQIVGFYSSKV